MRVVILFFSLSVMIPIKVVQMAAPAKTTPPQLRPPAPTLSKEQKETIKQRLTKQSSIPFTEDHKEAIERLEKMLKNRSYEDSIIGRLAYLAIFSALKSIDGNMVLDVVIGAISNRT